mgnify:CR=1 FL=1
MVNLPQNTHIVDNRYRSFDIHTGQDTTLIIPKVVRKSAYFNKNVVTIKIRKSGSNVGKQWYSNNQISKTHLNRNDIVKVLPTFNEFTLDRYFGQNEKSTPKEEVITVEIPKEENIIPAILDLQKTSSMDKVSNVTPIDVDTTDTVKIIETIHSAEKIKPPFLKMTDLKWKLLIRAVLRGKNIMMTGPSGEGKTLAVHAVKAALGRPFFYINLGNMQDPQTSLIGKTHFDKDKGTYFEESYFVKAIKTPNAIILLDEFTRLNDDAENILMSVLDYNQRYLRLTESVDSETINVAEGVSFLATANIGNEFTSTKVLDRAMLDRFTRIEVDPLTKDDRISLMSELFPNVDKKKIHNIADLADKIAVSYRSDTPDVDTLLSTRMCVETAELLNDGFLLVEAAEVTVFPFYSTDGGTNSPRTFVKQIIQGYGIETRVTGTSKTVKPSADALFGDDDFSAIGNLS